MEKSVYLNSTITVNDLKAEEKKYSEEIYRNLHAIKILMMHLNQKITNEFNEVFSEDMFIKPNTHAFKYVMHFLFTSLDANEFKKRFFIWPYSDKRGESDFRTSTLNYLNHLNVKHNLGLEVMRAHVAVLPGGLKFMKILHVIVLHVLKELLNKNRSDFIGPSELASAEYFRRNTAELNELVTSALELKKNLREDANLHSADTIKIKNYFKDNFDIELNRKVVTEVKEYLCSLMLELKPQFQNISKFRLIIGTMQQSSELVLKRKNNIICDRYQMEKCQQILKGILPQLLHNEINNIYVNNAFNYINVLIVYKHVMQLAAERFKEFKFRSSEAVSEELVHVDKICFRINALDKKVSSMSQSLDAYALSVAKDISDISTTQGSTSAGIIFKPEWKLSFCPTPPISNAVYGKDPRFASRRLPLMMMVDKDLHFNVSVEHALKPLDSTMNTSLNTSRTYDLDPMKMLNTIRKQNRTRVASMQKYYDAQNASCSKYYARNKNTPGLDITPVTTQRRQLNNNLLLDINTSPSGRLQLSNYTPLNSELSPSFSRILSTQVHNKTPVSSGAVARTILYSPDINLRMEDSIENLGNISDTILNDIPE